MNTQELVGAHPASKEAQGTAGRRTGNAGAPGERMCIMAGVGIMSSLVGLEHGW